MKFEINIRSLLNALKREGEEQGVNVDELESVFESNLMLYQSERAEAYLLFSIPSEHKEALFNGCLDEKVKEMFNSNNLILSDEAYVKLNTRKIGKPGEEKIKVFSAYINEKNTRYLIKPAADERLNVYRLISLDDPLSVELMAFQISNLYLSGKQLEFDRYKISIKQDKPVDYQGRGVMEYTGPDNNTRQKATLEINFDPEDIIPENLSKGTDYGSIIIKIPQKSDKVLDLSKINRCTLGAYQAQDGIARDHENERTQISYGFDSIN